MELRHNFFTPTFHASTGNIKFDILINFDHWTSFSSDKGLKAIVNPRSQDFHADRAGSVVRSRRSRGRIKTQNYFTPTCTHLWIILNSIYQLTSIIGQLLESQKVKSDRGPEIARFSCGLSWFLFWRYKSRGSSDREADIREKNGDIDARRGEAALLSEHSKTRSRRIFFMPAVGRSRLKGRRMPARGAD